LAFIGRIQVFAGFAAVFVRSRRVSTPILGLVPLASSGPLRIIIQVFQRFRAGSFHAGRGILLHQLAERREGLLVEGLEEHAIGIISALNAPR
jgi:hypothetical protein